MVFYECLLQAKPMTSKFKEGSDQILVVEKHSDMRCRQSRLLINLITYPLAYPLISKFFKISKL